MSCRPTARRFFRPTGLKRFDTPGGPITIGFIGDDAERHRQYRHPVGGARADIQGRGGDRECAGAAAQGGRRRRHRPAYPPGRQDCRSSPSATAATASTGDILPILRQARPGDHDGDLRPHPLGLCLPGDAADRRRPPAHQRRQIWLFRDRPPARVRSRPPIASSARTRTMSSSAMANAGATPPSKRWSTATRRRSRRSPIASSAI